MRRLKNYLVAAIYGAAWLLEVVIADWIASLADRLERLGK